MVRVAVARPVRVPLSDGAVARIVRIAMRTAKAVPRAGEISVAFVGPARMRALNRTYHHEDRVTDVLAFRALQGTRASGHEGHRARRPLSPKALEPDFGEIILCPSYIRTHANRAGEPFLRELERVLVHGTLHLLGYDHATPGDAERMFALQESIVRSLRV